MSLSSGVTALATRIAQEFNDVRAEIVSALSGKQPVDSDLTTIASLTATTDNIIQSVGSAWASRTPVQVKTALALNNVDNTTDVNKPISTATAEYVQSRVENLITNGSGGLNNNTNFTSFTFDAVDTHGGGGSFKKSGGPQTLWSVEYIPVNPTKYLRLDAWGKAGDIGGANYDAANKQYLGVECSDIDKLAISPQHFMKVAGSTDTTLAAELAPGATTVTLTNATGWHNSTTGHARNFLWWPYVNSKGYTYENYTYSRNGSFNYHADWATNGSWASGGISGNVITLRQPWAGPTLAAGTPVRNTQSASTYKYIAANNLSIPNAWTRYEGYIGTVDTTAVNDANKFSPGTAYVRLVFLINIAGASTTTVRWSDLWLSEQSTRNLELATASVPGVVTYGTSSGTAAQGSDSRIVNAVPKGSLVLNAADYGTLTSDYSSTGFDNAATIQAAITAAKDVGAIVQPSGDTYTNHNHRGTLVGIPPGCYGISTPLLMPRSGPDYRSHTIEVVGLGSRDSCRIFPLSSFPTGRALFEWEDPDDTNNDVRDQAIRNLTLEAKVGVGNRAIHFALTKSHASYGSDVNSIDTMYNVRFEDLIITGHNDYNQDLIRIEGRYDDGWISNVAADCVLGSGTYSTRLLHFDDFSLWSEFDDAEVNRYQDYPGCNFSRIQNIQVGHRGGRFTAIYGRVGAGSLIQNVNAGIGANGQNANLYLRDSGATVLESGFFEGFAELGVITLENSSDISMRNLVIGQTDEATSGSPGGALRYINCERITTHTKPSGAGVPTYSEQDSHLVIIDQNCRHLWFYNINGTGSFEDEWDIHADALNSNTLVIEYLDVETGRRTILPAPPSSSIPIVGEYLEPAGIRSTGQMAANTEYAIPIEVGQSTPLDRIAIEVTTAGTAGTVIRLGIRDSLANGKPGALILDAGTVDGASAPGVAVEATISTTILKPGVIWLTATAQSTGATLPSVRITQHDRPQVTWNTLAATFGSSLRSGYTTAATITSTLPSSYTPTNRTGIPPLLAVRCA